MNPEIDDPLRDYAERSLVAYKLKTMNMGPIRGS